MLSQLPFNTARYLTSVIFRKVLIYYSPNRSKITKQKSHRRVCLSGKGGLGKRSQENGPKAEKDQTVRATGLGTRPREEI